MAGDAPVVVVANPTAGRGKAGRLIGVADSMLRDLRIEHEIRVAGSAVEMESACRDAAVGGAEIVAVIGGDGTVSCAANGLAGTGAALAVLPAGTGSDFAAAIGARPFRAAVRLLADPKTVAVDVVRVRAGAVERCFVNVAGAGFDSEVNETANEMTVNLGGTGTYVAALVKTLSRFTPAHYDLIIDGQPLTVDAMLVVVGSGRSYGGGMKVLPEASLVDGVLDVCIVEALSKGAFLRAFPKVFMGRHTSHPKVRMMRATSVTITANRGMQVYADGEHVGPLPASFEVVPGALQVVVGPNAKGIS
ncbi:MAG: diacylglycerol kinase family lipid kinase [Actinobacteria bacterium]|nr:diacylglycerol kinase family lipid kinase [Actinomycetota bacterium]